MNWCQCPEPMVRCDHRGCICEICGLPEGSALPEIPPDLEPLWNEEMSRSYPHLWIARKFGLSHGVVLSYADAVACASLLLNVDVGVNPRPRFITDDAVLTALDLTYWQHDAVYHVHQLAPAVREDFVDAVLDARRLWLLAQTKGMAAALAV